jgi:predicted PurR-regulated permease PerM
MALKILTAIAAILALKYAQAIFLPVVLAFLISKALTPLVNRVAVRRIPRPLAAAMVMCVVLGAAGVLLYQLRYQADAVVRQLPEAAQRLRRTVEREKAGASAAIEQVQKAANELEKAADAAAGPKKWEPGVTRVQVEPAPLNITDYVWWGTLGVAALIGELVMILFLAYFLLASGDLYRRKMVKIAGPSLTQKRVTLQILEQIDEQIERFLLVQVVTSALVGVATWLAFRWIGLEQAGVWGLIAGVFNSIPYFGPVVVTGGMAVVAFLQFGTIEMAATVAGTALVITTLEGFLLTPWLTSRAAKMNAVAVFVGLIFWGWVWEVWGLLLAVPMLVIIKAVCDHVEDFKEAGELLSE